MNRGASLRRWRRGLAVSAFLFFPLLVGAGSREDAATGPSIIGIDHMPTAVADLDRASETYRKLGFALKPGRLHENGVRNNHVKFVDGSGIELQSPGKPTDELSTQYANFLKLGDGPVFIAFHVRDHGAMLRALAPLGFGYDDATGEFRDPLLDFLFLVGDNRAPTDKPEHFAHANSAFAMSGIWLALDDARRERFARLLAAMGAVRTTEAVLTPVRTDADVFAVQNGRVVVLPKHHQLQPGRAIVGVEFSVRDLSMTACGGGKGATASAARRSCVVRPSEAHGMWLEFHE